jgi:hypothetical protein
MSEELSNNPEGTATTTESSVSETTLNTEASSGDTNENIGNESSKPTKKVFGDTAQNRQSEALRKAKLDQARKPKSISLEDLADEDLPEGKGVDFRQVLEVLPDDAKTLIGNLRADYTRKTQELASQRKELEAQMKALTDGEFFKRVKEQASQPDVELDPYRTETFEARIQQEVARRMQEAFQPLQQQQELQMRQMKLTEFKTNHPDLDDMKHDVADLLKSNPSLSLQDAYFITKGKKSTTRLNALEQENAERKARMREIGLKIGQGKDVNPNNPPKGLKGYDLYQWFERQKQKKIGK